MSTSGLDYTDDKGESDENLGFPNTVLCSLTKKDCCVYKFHTLSSCSVTKFIVIE